MSSAKEDILARIRDAVGGSGDLRESDYGAISRSYRQAALSSSEDRLKLFAERLHDYDAVVYHCAQANVRETVRQALTARAKHGLIVPPGISQEWLPDGFLFVRDEGLSYDDMDKSEGVLTGCAVAIALTGTIVLRHSAAEGRRAITLVPDYHLCIVRREQVVETVPEGIREIAKYSGDPLTTISGPSATSDIEMTRIKGVHGPRTLDVILVAESDAGSRL